MNDRITLLIATNNPGKLREFRELLDGLPFDVVSLRDIGLNMDVEETGDTYEANARLKAEAYAQASGLPALADDSGIEVDALGGAPGPFSARFGGPGLNDEQRMRLLHTQMGSVPPGARGARYRAVLVLAAPGEPPRTASVEGVCEGIISFEERGANGFGYDPIFFLPEHGITMAEAPREMKNRISHRARAAQELRRLLERGDLAEIIGRRQG
ncbi:MAG: RdgB/HAM1 family non-canonical purine NTP pyrophosphatase [Chloroflexi bacterium]|nr:RdgB/HAM1 family non-canonical purine NTP pyrophosphatase [Chloroflexota bacterium]